jgi:hypothetical protein
MVWTEDPLPPPSTVLVITPALLSFAVTLLAVADVLVVGEGATIEGGWCRKGGADNDADKDAPFPFSPGGARVVGKQGDECKDALCDGVGV